MQDNIELVIFDLDGTLTNLKVDWGKLRTAKKHERDWETIERYELANIDQAEPIERNVVCVKGLRESGCRLAICSSNMYETVVQSLKILGIRDCFEIIVGGDNVNNQKPDPEGLDTIVKILGVAKDKTLFIGNNWKDEEAGKRANIQTVLLESIKSSR